MKIELEAKCRVDDHVSVLEALQKLNATPVACMLEKNIFFDTSDRRMASGDCGLRVRILDFEGDRESEAVVTFKGPRNHGQLKSRPEIEFSVDHAAPMVAMLGELGYHEVIRFEKRRDRWHYADCTIELDELPHLGCFVEIEGPDDATVLKVRDELGLAGRPLLRSSYVALLWSHLMQEHIDDREITFERTG